MSVVEKSSLYILPVVERCSLYILPVMEMGSLYISDKKKRGGEGIHSTASYGEKWLTLHLSRGGGGGGEGLIVQLACGGNGFVVHQR